VVRTKADLDLRVGVNEVTTTNVTTQLEPDLVSYFDRYSYRWR
jgi:hypothetical protein